MSDENATTAADAAPEPPATPDHAPADPHATHPVGDRTASLADTAEHVPLPDPDDVPPTEAEAVEPEVVDATAEAAPTDESAPVDEVPETETEIEPEPAEVAEAVAAVAEEDEPEAADEEPAADEALTAVPDPAAVVEPAAEPPTPVSPKKWYVVKIQSGREETIKAAIERKVRIEGLEEFFGQIAVPTEDTVEKKKVKVKVKDKKTGEVETVYQEKNVTKKRKKYPGYLFAEVEFNDRMLYLFRETSGVGDFVGATHTRAPNPMPDHEVQQMLTGIAAKGPKGGKVKVKLDYEKGDKVKIKDGAFSGMEGEVKAITEPKDATETPKVTVEVTIFGRPVPVDLDYWQVDKA